jgi:hypothetical protein
MASSNPLEKKRDLQINSNPIRQQKIAVVFLAMFAILIFVLWGWQFNTQLNKPFATDKKVQSGPIVNDLHLVDSDNDGLSDYDEINIYHTSPYLEDSDSDTINDKQEISQGSDPNCPSGKVCGTTQNENVNNSSASSTNNQITNSPVVSGEATIVPGIGNEVTPAMLRQILLQNGYDAATLEKISDEDIMRSYQEAVKSQSGASATSTTNQ